MWFCCCLQSDLHTLSVEGIELSWACWQIILGLVAFFIGDSYA